MVATVSQINTAIDAVQSYIDTLQAALTAAANSGNTGAANSIESHYDDAQLLESKLKGLLTTTDAAGLTAAVSALSVTTTTLKTQSTQIDTDVKDVGLAANVVGQIAAIMAAVVKLA